MPDQDLEAKLLEDVKQGKDIHLERALLILSGLNSEEEIAGYVKKIDQLEEGFEAYKISKRDVRAYKELREAIRLFDYLWDKKPKRYNNKVHLTEVIDMQLSKHRHQTVGNCIGLTSLYTVLGLRKGLNLSILHSHNHVKNRLRINKKEYDIENTLSYGFNFKQNDFVGNSVNYLLNVLFNNNGLRKYDAGNFCGAIKDYDSAIEINPKYYQTYNNRGIVKRKLGYLEGAIQDYDKTIEINPEYYKAYNNRGISKKESGDLDEAIKDYDKAIEINPEYYEAYNNRAIVKRKLGDLKGAIKDYNKAMDIRPEFSQAYHNREIAKKELRDRECARF